MVVQFNNYFSVTLQYVLLRVFMVISTFFPISRKIRPDKKKRISDLESLLKNTPQKVEKIDVH